MQSEACKVGSNKLITNMTLYKQVCVKKGKNKMKNQTL